MVATQWRAGGLGVVGLDLPAVLQLAYHVGLELTERDLFKLRLLERAELAEQAQQAEKTGGE